MLGGGAEYWIGSRWALYGEFGQMTIKGTVKKDDTKTGSLSKYFTAELQS